MLLKPGQRLASTVCDAEFVVVKAPDTEVDLSCGGAPLVEPGTEAPRGPLDSSLGDAPLLGKRYADDDRGVELLCSKAGEGALTLDGVALPLKGAKPLPSSD